MVLRKLVEDAANTWARKSRMRLLQSRLISMTPSDCHARCRQIAGLNVLPLSTSPQLRPGYGLDKKRARPYWSSTSWRYVDVSILEVGEGVFEVKATAGDTHLGGDDFDKRVSTGSPKSSSAIRALIYGVTVRHLHGLTEAAEKAKIELSSVVETTISLPFITRTLPGQKHWRCG